MGFHWRQKLFPFFFLSFFSLIFTVLTFVLGAPLFRAFHRLYGWRVFFYFYSLMIFLALWVYPLWGVLFLILWGALSLFFFFYRSQKVETFLRASLLSTGLSFLFVCLILGFASHWNMGDLYYNVQACVQALLEKANNLNPHLQGFDALNVQKIVLQLPFLFFLMIFMSLFFSISLEYPLYLVLRVNSGVADIAKHQFLAFKKYKLPDLCVWITLSAFLLTFFLKKSPILGPLWANVASICASLYFFQGFAILECFFADFLGLKSVWRFLLYMVLLMYLSFVVIFIGFADYWLDFRLRMRKKLENKT